MTSENNALSAFSNQLADAVEQAGQSVVAVNARRRHASSGVYWRSGIVVTADHTVNRDEEISVTLPDGRSVSATVAGRDAGTDLALLKLQNVERAIAQIGNSSALRVGEMVLAIARSSEGATSASLGVIGSIGGSWRSWHGGRIDQFICPSLNLYPGFSGGPLINAQGQVIGINTAGPRHMTLSIPVATVNRVVDQLLQTGRIARGYLGLGMQPVRLPETLARSLNLSKSGGVIVVSIEPTGPGDQAGVLLGDIITALDGTAIADIGDVHAVLDPDRVGHAITAQMIRGGALIETTITVGERPGREK
ncbi:S1C family serine protease [Phormidesmis sp. 146-33]